MMYKKGGVGKIAAWSAIILVIAVVVGFMGFDKVDASHIGVKNQFGVIKGSMQPGMMWTGLFVHVEQYDLRMRKMDIDMLEGEKTAVDIDGQTVKARIKINYRLNPENTIDAYTKVGRDKNLAEILNIEGIVREGFKSTTSKYESVEIWQKRQEVKEAAIVAISSNFPNQYFILENVIISDLDFNPDFIAAIELQKTNERLAITKEKEVEIARFEADRKIEEARGFAESAALQILEKAKADAKALELKRQQLTPLMVQNNWIDAWNGQLPKFVLGDGASQGMFLNLALEE